MNNFVNIYDVYRRAGRGAIDYVALKSFLSGFKYPRLKIRQWLKDGSLIRIKKGLYVFGEKIAIFPYEKEGLAPLIYGPSAISLEYALSYYALIPERVDVITSITPKRDKIFRSPIGTFSYRYASNSSYYKGIRLITTKKGEVYLMACPEKALLDVLAFSTPPLENLHSLTTHLNENLRLDQEYPWDILLLKDLSASYSHKNITLLMKLIGEKNACP